MTEYDENGVILDGPLKGSHTRPPSVHGGRREIVWHRPVPAVREQGMRHTEYRESHPAWGLVSAHRVSSTPGAVLFDSDIQHQHYMRVTLRRASRDRGLSRDWIHEEGPTLIEIDMSEAQWASFVSSTNTSGVPCTIRATETDHNVDRLHFEPRLKESMDEVRGATQKMMDRLKEAVAAFDALDPKAGVKERRAAMGKIRSAANSAEANATFVAKSLEEHAENVVQKARADVEAMVHSHAERLGLDPKQTLNDLAFQSSVTPQTSQAALASGQTPEPLPVRCCR